VKTKKLWINDVLATSNGTRVELNDEKSREYAVEIDDRSLKAFADRMDAARERIVRKANRK